MIGRLLEFAEQNGYVMRNWLKVLLSKSLLNAWWILSAFSTLSSFFFRGLAGKPRLVSAISTILGFACANYRVFRKQETQILELRQAIESQEVRTSQLRITPKAGSRYILRPVSNVPKGDFNAMYLEFYLMVENTGRRNSTVNNYQVEVVELHRTFANLAPEVRQAVHGRHSEQGLDPRTILSTTGVIKIDAESATNYGTLLFFIPDVNRGLFEANGLHMAGGERKFPPLRCRLTLTDTTLSSTTGEFQLHEE